MPGPQSPAGRQTELTESRALSEWEKTLRGGFRPDRRAAALDSPHQPHGAVPGALTRALEDDEVEVRLGAVASMEKLGTAAVPALIVVLSNRHPEVRLAAAAALGRLGDLQARAPLETALERCLRGGRALTIALAGALFAIALLAGVQFWLGDRTSLRLPLLVPQLMVPLSFLLIAGEHRAKARETRALTDALAALAEGTPAAELEATAARLRAASRDPIGYDRATRRACREAASTLELQAERKRSLPLAAGQAGSATNLPLPAHPGGAAAAELPRVADREAANSRS